VDPACASVCPVGALKKSDEGPVVYDATICMGCRYCMMACPYGVPRYEWNSAAPRIRKCVMCHDAIERGRVVEPACTGSCPVDATIFGKRDELLRVAHDRIREHPGRYIPRVFGEHEVGGTSVLYLSDVDLSLPERYDENPLPARAWAALRFVPPVFIGVGAAALGLRWLIGRRQQLMEEQEVDELAAALGHGEPERPDDDEKGDS
jgi:formate dehydrogenase iron-sulfur subunit